MHTCKKCGRPVGKNHKLNKWGTFFAWCYTCFFEWEQ